MIGASKILTVSYGTFSCTLEGFDDPFNTMKAIAEYFRDLAAEDRYFGAEPPQPDAAMLHRIAEREIQRRVEARVQDNGVILRAESQPERVAAPVPAPAVIPAQDAHDVTESVAAKLSKLRAAKAVAPVAELAETVAEPSEALLPEPDLAALLAAEEPASEPPAAEAAAEEAQVEVAAEAAVVNDELAQAVPAEEGAIEALAVEESPAAPEPFAEPTATPEPQAADTAAPAAAAEDLAEAAPARPEPAAAERPVLPEGLDEDLTEDAARALSDALGGPVATHSLSEIFPEGEDETQETAAESLDADEADTPAADAVADILPETAPEMLAEPSEASVVAEEALADILPETAPEAARDAADDVDVAALIATLTGNDGLATTGQAEADAEPVAAEAVLMDEVEAEADEIEAEAEEPLAAAAPEAEIETVEVAAEAWVELPAEAEIEAEIEAEAEIGDRAEPAADLAAEADPVPDEDMRDDGAAEAIPARPEAEARLQRARARVVRIRRTDLEPPAPQPEAPAEAAAPQDAEEPRRKLEPQADDAALNRLIAQTNSEMEGPEAKRRLSAIAHLKAAVAATVADRLKGHRPAASDAARAEPYRDDLARAVRPSRPEAPGARADRPAPLVLVSEQRIDRPAPPAPPAQPAPAAAHAGPVRPRRVTSAALAVQASDDDEDDDDDSANIFADTRGFVEFAEKLGVRSLPDLMEAAAAYTASVEGRPHFSRPHLIKHLSAARGVEIPREDSLRTFGRLLREGRIEKVKRGQFVVNEGSRFLAEARKVSG